MALKALDKVVKQIREKNGYCVIPNHKYATVRARRVHCVTGEEIFVDAHWMISEYDGRKTLKIFNGPTGWEEWEIYHLLSFGLDGKDAFNFCACAGTKNRWDEFWLNGSDVWDVLQDAIALHPDLF